MSKDDDLKKFLDEHVIVIPVPGTSRLSERDPREQSIPSAGAPLPRGPRRLSAIAQDIAAHWPAMPSAAKVYVHAMLELNTIDDKLMTEKGKDIVAYFLANCATWRGEDARRIKAELREIIK